MEVRAGHIAGGADAADGLTGGDPLVEAVTSIEDWWLYEISVPSSSSMTVWYPYEPDQPADFTVPLCTALIGVPVGAAKSRPVW